MSPQKTTFVGQDVIVRTVTHYYTGHVTAVTDDGWIILTDAAWIADTGRFSKALAGGTLSEVEPYPDGPVWINSGAVIDLTLWTHPLPRTMK